MDSKLGSVTYDNETGGFLGGAGSVNPFQYRRYSEETAREIDLSVKMSVDKAFQKALSIVDKNRATLEKSAEALLEKETLTEEDLKSLFSELQQLKEV
jgi:cell division protease FtsH